MKIKNIIDWVLKIIASAIMLQTLRFKFSGSEDSIELFTRLGVEPWGRIATGVLELIAGVLLLIPKTAVHGALLTFVIMFGAISSHFLILGVAVDNDGGELFVLAVLVFICCALSLWINKLHFKATVLNAYHFFSKRSS